MARILLTHSPQTRANYYGARALAGLQALGDVVIGFMIDLSRRVTPRRSSRAARPKAP